MIHISWTLTLQKRLLKLNIFTPLLAEIPFDRTLFDRKIISSKPKSQFTDKKFNRKLFDRIYFRQKVSFDQKTWQRVI
jgi:hypothetical protein